MVLLAVCALAASYCLQRNAMPHCARSKALEKWVLTTDRHQRIRMVMSGFAFLVALCSIVLINLAALAGTASAHWMLAWSLLTGAGSVASIVLIRSGWSRRLRDPALTQFQIRYALVCNAMAYVLLGPARGISLVLLSLIMLFGVFDVSPRQMAMNIAYALALFSVAFAVVVWLDESHRSPGVEVAYAAMVVIVMLGITFVTVRLHKIRQRLTRQKHELTLALFQIQQLATHDELTGLPNRRHMLALLEAEHLRSQRDTRPWMVALLDIDFFKLVNDTHGHAAGDQVLQAFAATVREAVRSTDMLARWGGEEFLLLLHDTQPGAARLVLERVRQAVQERTVAVQNQQVRVTVSIGVAAHTAGKSVAQLLDQADQALYRAKSDGRNCVVEAEPLQATAQPEIAII